MAGGDSSRDWVALVMNTSSKRWLVSSEDGASWSARELGDAAGDQAVLTTARDGAVWAAGRDEDGQVWTAQVTDEGLVDRATVPDFLTPHRPAITFWHGWLVLAATDENGHVYVARGRPGEELRFRRADPDALSSAAPALAGSPSRLHLAITGTDGALYLASSDDGVGFEFWPLEMKARAATGPSMTSWGEHLALALVDRKGRIWLGCSRGRRRFAMSHVGGDAVSHRAPALAMDDTGVLVMLTGTDERVYVAKGEPSALEFQLLEQVPETSAALTLARARKDEPTEPSRTVVRPVLFCPADVAPDEEQIARYRDVIGQHLALAQQRYRTWLVSDTFPFVDAEVVRGARDHRDYRKGDAFTDVKAEVFEAVGDCELTSTAAFVVFFLRPPGFEDELWLGAGGGAEGSGMVLLDGRCILEDQPYPFQSTLVHELGHAFGLPHVDAWGEDMDTCDSVMSYNPRHHTSGVNHPDPDGSFLPEELHLLGQNQVAFPDFRFDPSVHNPSGRRLRKARDV